MVKYSQNIHQDTELNYAIIGVNKQYKNAVTQELEIINWASSKNITIDKTFFDKSRDKEELGERKEFLTFLGSLSKGDRVLVSSLETLGWRVGELVQIIAKVFDKKCEIICIDTNEVISPKMEAEIIISKLSKVRKQNIKIGISKLGRPKGSRSKSKYDAYLPQIIKHLKTNRNISALARELGISRTSLKDYIASRGL